MCSLSRPNTCAGVKLMVEIERLTPHTWKNFLDAPAALLVLGKEDCEPCMTWIQTLTIDQDQRFTALEVRIGYIALDASGFAQFKIAHPWVSLVDMLPFNALFINGERAAEWAGGSIERLIKELKGRV